MKKCQLPVKRKIKKRRPRRWQPLRRRRAAERDKLINKSYECGACIGGYRLEYLKSKIVATPYARTHFVLSKSFK